MNRTWRKSPSTFLCDKTFLGFSGKSGNVERTDMTARAIRLTEVTEPNHLESEEATEAADREEITCEMDDETWTEEESLSRWIITSLRGFPIKEAEVEETLILDTGVWTEAAPQVTLNLQLRKMMGTLGLLIFLCTGLWIKPMWESRRKVFTRDFLLWTHLQIWWWIHDNLVLEIQIPDTTAQIKTVVPSIREMTLPGITTREECAEGGIREGPPVHQGIQVNLTRNLVRMTPREGLRGRTLRAYVPPVVLCMLTCENTTRKEMIGGMTGKKTTVKMDMISWMTLQLEQMNIATTHMTITTLNQTISTRSPVQNRTMRIKDKDQWQQLLSRVVMQHQIQTLQMTLKWKSNQPGTKAHMSATETDPKVTPHLREPGWHFGDIFSLSWSWSYCATKHFPKMPATDTFCWRDSHDSTLRTRDYQAGTNFSLE